MVFKVNRASLINVMLLLISVFALLIPALTNGYPIFFSDSGTYLSSGHSGYVPVDRPLLYGLFVRHISLSWSIWLVIIMQSILFNYLLFLVGKFVVKAKNPVWVQAALAITLAAGTGIGYYCSLVIADIFASIAVLTLFFLLTLPKKEKLHLVLLSIILILSMGVHLSHIPLVAGTAALVFFYSLFFQKQAFKSRLRRVAYVAGLSVTSLLVLATINYSNDGKHDYNGGFKVSRTNNIILATRYIESGIANRYLKKHCGDSNFNPPYANLCNYIDQFEQWPAAGVYLYSNNSPLYDGPCADKHWTNCWDVKNEAYGQLIKDILSEEEYRLDFIALALTGTLKQFFTFEQSSLPPVSLEHIIKKYYEDDLYQYQNATQHDKTLEFKSSTMKEVFVFNISLILIIVLFFKYWKRLSSADRLFVLTIFLYLLVNAFVTATLSNVIPRYQGRLTFLLPLLLITLGIKVLKNKNITLKIEV